MDAEEGDRQCGPTDPRPQLPPWRQGLTRIQLTAEHGQPMRPLNATTENAGASPTISYNCSTKRRCRSIGERNNADLRVESQAQLRQLKD